MTTDRTTPVETLPTGAKLRMGRMLEERARNEGGYANLARVISANYLGRPVAKAGDKKKDIVDRRKLQAIVASRKGRLTLSLTQLLALDRYLEPFGEGLAFRPLFEKPDIMQALAESGRVTFLLGSKPGGEGSSHFNYWDVLALAEVQRSLNAYAMRVQIEIQDVPTLPDFDPTSHMEGDGWSALFGPAGPSLICLASNRSMPASEVMLCGFGGTQPFRNTKIDDKRNQPFHFMWNTMADALPSRFQIGPGQVAARDPDAAQAVRSESASALVTEDEVFVDRVTSRGFGDVYGLCAAQRRENGKVWLLLGGVSAPATYAAAKLANRLPIQQSEAKRGEHGDVQWSIVSGHIPESKKGDEGLRELGEQIRVGPCRWRPGG